MNLAGVLGEGIAGQHISSTRALDLLRLHVQVTAAKRGEDNFRIADDPEPMPSSNRSGMRQPQNAGFHLPRRSPSLSGRIDEGVNALRWS